MATPIHLLDINASVVDRMAAAAAVNPVMKVLTLHAHELIVCISNRIIPFDWHHRGRGHCHTTFQHLSLPPRPLG